MTRAHLRSVGWMTAGGAALALLCVAPGNAAAARKTNLTVKTSLAATGIDADAHGRTGFAVRGADGKFEVKASRLDHHASYDVVVKGVKVGTLQTTGGGNGHLRFRSRPGPKDLVLGFEPRGAQLSVRGADGHDVLVGTMPDDTIDPTATACCVPDDDGESECEALTPDACTAAGGTATEAATCVPDPCAPPPSEEIVCCTNETGDDESESECEKQTPADCSAAGGMVVEATSCEPNPCAPAPPPAGDAVACCLTHEDETECKVTTSEACTASSGTVMTGITCDPDPCGSGSGSGGGDDGGGDGGGGGGDGGGGGGD